MAFCLLGASAQGAVLSIAHRGNSIYAPENTIAAFKSALPVADYVELDGQVSSDGKIVVMHDSTVNRTTDASGPVSSFTAAQLRQLDAGSWFAPAFQGEPVPTLEEAITSIIPAAIPLVERKAGTASAYVEELRRLGVVDKVVVQAFDWNFLAAVHALEPTIRLGALGSGTLTLASITTIKNAGASMVAWERAGVNAATIHMARTNGLQVLVWTVDGPEISNFIQMGVDGIISNDPGMVRKLQQPAPISPTDLARGLVTYWKMDDGLTNAMEQVVRDSKSTNHTSLVRLDNLSHWVSAPESKMGGAVHLDGSKAYIPVPRNSFTDLPTNALSISIWVKLWDLPSTLATPYGAVLDSTNDCYVLYLDRSNKELRFKVTDATGHAARPGIPESALLTNIWLHLAATYAGNASPSSGQAAIYLNGAPVDTHTGGDGLGAGLTARVKSGQYAALGREGPAGGNYFRGMVDDFALWDRALTPAEVKAIFDAGHTGMSLGDRLQVHVSALLRIRSSRYDAASLTIDFTSEGPWQNFRLLGCTSPVGPFEPFANLFPIRLRDGSYRFTFPASSHPSGFFAIEAQ